VKSHSFFKINGLSLGFFLTLGSTYASEIAPIALRPSLTAAVNLFINAGQLTAIAIGNTRYAILTPASYKVIFAAQWAFPCLIALVAILMPESPWYLCRKGHFEQAKKSLQRLHLESTDKDLIMEDIRISIAAENAIAEIQKDTTYWDCFRDTNWRRTRISCGMFAVQQFTGIAFYSQSLYFLGISGLPTALTYQLALGGFGVAMFGNIVSWFIMNYIGNFSSLSDTKSRSNIHFVYRAPTPPSNWNCSQCPLFDVCRYCWMLHHQGRYVLHWIHYEFRPTILRSHGWSRQLDDQRRSQLS
jgi:SP family general alpha glucoside:H+ symporter-like MFS transporter